MNTAWVTVSTSALPVRRQEWERAPPRAWRANGQWAGLGGPFRLTRRTGQPATVIPVANYSGSYGDNYSGGPLCGGCLPWETYPAT